MDATPKPPTYILTWEYMRPGGSHWISDSRMVRGDPPAGATGAAVVRHYFPAPPGGLFLDVKLTPVPDAV